MINKYKYFLISFLVFGLALTAFVFTTQANILSISFVPPLNISLFSPYKIQANISGAPISASVEISGINGNVLATTTCWDYYVDGRCGSDPITKGMSNPSGDLWESEDVYPDSVYPEIYFVDFSVTINNQPTDQVFNRNNYQLLNFSNPFEMVDGMSFFIEFNTAPQSTANSADLEVYLVAKNKDISFFNTDWRNSSEVALVGTINRSQNFHHTHTSNSAHYLVALSTDSTGKVAGLDVSDDFWVILYNNSPNNARGWSLRYQTICDAETSGYWYQGSQANWSTSLQTGCPDVHIHVARTLTDINTTVQDGVQAVVTATYNDSSVDTSSEFIYFTPLANLPPNPTSFISPVSGNVYSEGPIEISWNPATDPNNDPLLYDIHLLDSEGLATSTLATATTTTSFSWDITGVPNGQYSLKGVITEATSTPLSTDFFLGGNFTIDQAATLYSLSNINLASNNASTTLAKAGDVVTLTFQSSGEIDPVVNIYSGGTQIDSGRVNIAFSTNNFTVTYVVQAADDNGSVSFEISASNLDQIYNDTTNSSYVIIDNTISVIVCGETTINHNGLTYGTIMKDGLCWLDRNLGASRVCTSIDDEDCFGDYYQWGRGLDGHQILGSEATFILSDYDYPGHGDFIVTGDDPFDWRNPQNSNLWQGVFGINNPCPLGFRLPTDAELTTERGSWSTPNSAGAFDSTLKLPSSSLRTALSGLPQSCIGDCFGGLWSSSVDSVDSMSLTFGIDFAEISLSYRANGINVRCVRDDLVSLTYTTGTGGTITGETSQTILEGQDGTTVTAVPNTGYTFTSWSDGVLTASRTDTNVTADITVTANFTLNTYTLTYTAGTGGTISGTSPQTVNHGSSGTEVTAVPDTGYTFTSWSDGVSTASRTDTNVTTNITVTANFTPNTYTLTYTAGTGGTISGTSPQTVNHGSSGTEVTAVADTGYTFTSWSDGVSTASRTDTNVTTNITVTANFTINQYTLTFNSDGGTAVDPITQNYDTAITPPANPTKTGYTFSGWSPTIPTTMPATNQTHTAQWTINQYTLTFNSDGGTAVDPITQNYDTAITPPANPTKIGHTFTGWSPTIPTNMPATNQTHTAQWTINQYTLTYTAGVGGSITGETSQTVLEGQDGAIVTAIPITNYEFYRWSDNSTNNPRTDTNVTADITVTAEFNLISSGSPDPTPSSSSSSPPPPPAIGDGQTDVTVPMNSLGSLGEVDSGGVNYLSYVGSQASFSTPISTTNNLSDHWLVINNLDLNSQLISLTIKSEPQTFQLALGQSVLVDLDGDNIKDIEVKFTDLVVNRTELTITSILRDQIISPPILELPVIDSKAITQEARNSFTGQNLDLSQRLAGQILLQVENHGQAWYLDPLSQMRYYLGRPDDAFAIMRKKGIGITNINLAKIPVSLRFLSGLDSDGDGLPDNLEIALGTNPNNRDSDGDGYDDYTELLNGYTPLGIGRLNYDLNFAKAQAGKIFLQVEGRGEAWYVSPENNQRYFLGRPADALSIMKGLSLGISNVNLNQLLVGEID